MGGEEAGLASYDHVTTEAAPLQVARFAVTSAYGAGRWLADCLRVGGALLGGPCLALPSSSPRWRCSGGILSGSGPAGRLGVRAAGYPRVEGPSSDRKGSPVAGCWDSSLRTGVTVPARGAGGMGWWPGGHLGPRGLRCGQGCWGAGKDTDPGELGHHRCWRLPVVDPTSRKSWETLVRCFATCVWSDSYCDLVRVVGQLSLPFLKTARGRHAYLSIIKKSRVNWPPCFIAA